MRHPNHPSERVYSYARGRFSTKGRKSDKVRKKYIEPWRCGPIRLTKCAARFSAAERTITEWKFEEVQ